MTSRKRKGKILVDPKLQGALVGRTLRYWLIFTCAIFCFAVSGWFLYSPDLLNAEPTTSSMPSALSTFFWSLLATTVLLPFIVIDQLRFSSRFIGPMKRLGNAMDRVSRGEQVEPVIFRDGDLWCEFAEKFNAVVQRIKELEDRQSDDDCSEEHSGHELEWAP